MDIQRIHSEVTEARATFPNVEAHPTNDGGVFVKALFQTSAGNVYFSSIQFASYPTSMPKVFITKPDIQAYSIHRYNTGNICYLHPNMWNPGRHNLTFVLGRTAKWLNKFDVWRATGKWPGAELRH